MSTKKNIYNYLTGFRYALPVQLLLLHFKKYQLLLVVWYVLFATVNGSFMYRFGAHMLFLYPEYLGKVNIFSTFLVGGGFGIFVMCWNITTFILFSRYFKFLAATTQPFLKYCINNGILPLLFLLFYLAKAVQFARGQELLSWGSLLALGGGFLLGFLFIIAVSFLYFFGADRTIYKRMSVQTKKSLAKKVQHHSSTRRGRPRRLRIDWYLSATLKLRQPRNVAHYDDDFLESIFGQHHLAAIFSVLLVFGGLITAGFLQDNVYFQLPSAGSIMVFFAILIALAGGLSHFLRQWSLLVAGLFLLGLNMLYQTNILDPRNKAYGLQYQPTNKALYTASSLQAAASPELMTADSLQYINMLNNWKKKQPTDSPTMVLLAVSGGGTRAATFTTNVLRQIDSISQGGLMPSTFLITGASGGMLGAAWYRELYSRNQTAQPPLTANKTLTDAIGKDLLNPLFSSFVTRDLLSPAQYFTYAGHRYTKDRGYAFETKLNNNTFGWMDKPMQGYAVDEYKGNIPLLIGAAVVTRDGRRLLFANHAARFLTRPQVNNADGKTTFPDAIDFVSFFERQQSRQLKFLSVLRMNATFPYILPNVWLPTQPVIDVMDAGFRDNTGLEMSISFAWYFRQWIQENCSNVLLLQVRDKPEGGWDAPQETDNIFDLVSKPALLTQTNLFRFQEYAQLKQLEPLQQVLYPRLKRIVLEYRPSRQQDAASLSFHLTRSEQLDIENSLLLPHNQHAIHLVQQLLQPPLRHQQPK